PEADGQEDRRTLVAALDLQSGRGDFDVSMRIGEHQRGPDESLAVSPFGGDVRNGRVPARLALGDEAADHEHGDLKEQHEDSDAEEAREGRRHERGHILRTLQYKVCRVKWRSFRAHGTWGEPDDPKAAVSRME